MTLDDYENIEQNSSISSSNDVINAEDVIQSQIDFWSNWVDLGLPSGTLWCKYNLGVNPNQLSKPEDWYGDYYAWGEIQSKECKHTWETYKFSPGGHALFDKYVSNERFAISELDNLKQLQRKDDVAYMKNGENRHIHMPTHNQLEELVQYTLHQWVQDFNGIKNLGGCVFTSYNDMTKYIFIPAAGYRGSQGLCNIQQLCGIWSSTQSHNTRSDLATALIMSNSRGVENEVEIENRYRCGAFSIRAVYK